jgi:hypothetical protein
MDGFNGCMLAHSQTPCKGDTHLLVGVLQSHLEGSGVQAAALHLPHPALIVLQRASMRTTPAHTACAARVARITAWEVLVRSHSFRAVMNLGVDMDCTTALLPFFPRLQSAQ